MEGFTGNPVIDVIIVLVIMTVITVVCKSLLNRIKVLSLIHIYVDEMIGKLKKALG